jgi:hypothetical protein
MKIMIAPESSPETFPYEHLKPIVRLLLENGNEPSKPRGEQKSDELRFYKNRDGWICILRYPIDFDLIRRECDLPDSIRLDEKQDTILCERSWIEIRGNIT